MMLIFATNLRIDKLSDPAFLRRLGYRVEIEPPSVEDYALIFQRCSEKRGVAIEPELVSHLVGRYQSESRTMRACEPRDLIDRALEVCRFRGQPERVDAETLDLAWVGYFGTGEFLEVGGRSLADAAASSS